MNGVTNITTMHNYWHIMEGLLSIPVMLSMYEFLSTSSFLMLSLAVVLILCALGAYYVINSRRGVIVTPESVNFHFTRRCNYKCGFCFHTAKTSFLLDIDEAKKGLQMLKDAGDVAASFCLYDVSISK